MALWQRPVYWLRRRWGQCSQQQRRVALEAARVLQEELWGRHPPDLLLLFVGEKKMRRWVAGEEK